MDNGFPQPQPIENIKRLAEQFEAILSKKGLVDCDIYETIKNNDKRVKAEWYITTGENGNKMKLRELFQNIITNAKNGSFKSVTYYGDEISVSIKYE